MSSPESSFDIDGARRRLAEDGGYEIVHESPGLEVGVAMTMAIDRHAYQPETVGLLGRV